MSDEEHDCNCPPEGLPAYMGTFADLMALLMCFFVLLLSFAEMDVLKFKRLAGSMKNAFGVQNQIEANSVPKGTSIIAQEFSPGRPEPTPIIEIKQRTTDENQRNLEVQCTPESTTEALLEAESEEEIVNRFEELIQATQRDALDLANALKDEITEGKVEVATKGRDIIIRIKEKGSFNSGSATLQTGFADVLADVKEVLATKRGRILVQGHTDNIAISTSRFRSNWELSSARAVSVAHELLKGELIKPQRFTVSGFGFTRPLVENSSVANRALNRRVEIVISQGLDDNTEDELRDLKEENPGLYKSLEIDNAPLFKIDADEIF